MAAVNTSSFAAFDELVTSTFRNHKGEVADQISNHNALYRRIAEKKNVRVEDGGLSIVANLEYAQNTTYQRYSGYDALTIDPVDVITAAEFPWRQVAVHLAASGRDIRINSGKSAIFNLAKSKLRNLIHSFANGMSQDLYSAGTATNQINGLQALIADAGTGTVGGINSTTWTFWKNIIQSAASPLQGGAGITPGAGTMESLMLPLWLKLTRGADKPDLIVMDEIYYSYYEQSQTSLKRYAPSDDGKGGMISLKYKSADVVHDTAASGIPASHAYFINTDYIEVVVHKDANLEILDDKRSLNQDAVVKPVIWMGNLVTNARFLQGVMKA
jgi:hypothetical protein